jgi:hypothetical protein
MTFRRNQAQWFMGTPLFSLPFQERDQRHNPDTVDLGQE